MGFQNIGPDYWKGETGRDGADRGQGEVHRPAICRRASRSWRTGRPTWATAIRRRPIPTARTCSRSARARSIPPAPGTSRPSAPARKFPMGAFPPPLPAGDTDCYISDHTDIGMGLNAASKNQARRQEIPGMGGDAGIRDALRQRAARLLPAVLDAGDDQGRSRRDLRLAGARSASRRSATPTRSCRAARRTWRTNCGTSRRRSSTAR